MYGFRKSFTYASKYTLDYLIRFAFDAFDLHNDKQPLCILRTNVKNRAWWHTHRKQFHSNGIMETLCQCSLCSLNSLFFVPRISYKMRLGTNIVAHINITSAPNMHYSNRNIGNTQFHIELDTNYLFLRSIS